MTMGGYIVESSYKDNYFVGRERHGDCRDYSKALVL
jgi:hypothetical protein